MHITDLFEARLDFTPEDLDKHKADNSERGINDYAHLWMDEGGTIHLGDDPFRSRNQPTSTIVTVSLDFKSKIVDLKIFGGKAAIGNKIVPRAQQFIAALKHTKLIDSSWTIRTASGVGHYPNGGSTYKTIPEPVDHRGVDYAADPKNRFSPADLNDLIFYHGTSTIEWKKIETSGLVPLFTGSNKQTTGGESRGKYDQNDKVLYLATNMHTAEGYAKERMEGWKRRLTKAQDWKQLDDLEIVILEVRVPDPARLVADDDLVNSVMRRISNKLFAAKSPAEQAEIMAELSKSKGFQITDRSVAEMLWRETETGFDEILSKAPPRLWKLWRASITRHEQVGYKGFIPASYIKRIL